MADSLDMVNRDPNGMNSYIQVTFPEVLAEPEGAHSGECLWRNAFKCFNGGLNCGLPAGLYLLSVISILS